MQIYSANSTSLDTGDAVAEIISQLEAEQARPDLLIVYWTEAHDAERLLQGLRERYPDIAIQGGTSCQAVMTDAGFHSENKQGLAVLALQDPGGDYGVGAADLSEDPRRAASEATLQAMQVADRPGEVPQLVWLVGAPGHEEDVLDGIADVLGSNIPVAGGSTGDNAIVGNWKQLTRDGVRQNAVTVSLLYASGTIGYAFHSGYSPSEKQGTVTGCEERTIFTIDGRPAAEVYNEWADNCIDSALNGETDNILSLTTLYPLGRKVGSINNVPYYRLSHPDALTPERGLSLFSNIREGDRIALMTGSVESLISRAGRVADSAMASQNWRKDEVAGALVIYCAGCMLTVQEQMPQVVDGLNDHLGGVPFVGTYTFGEQGCFREGENYHGNLMISVVLFHR